MPQLPKSVLAYLDEPCPRCGVAIGLHPYRKVATPLLPAVPVIELFCPPPGRRCRPLVRKRRT